MKRGRNPESGFALLLVFLMAAAIAITLYMQLPRVAFESQRTREQLLISRGEQYKRAIQLYVKKNGRYPATLDDLDKGGPGNQRYLRHRYVDPMTGKDEWRIVHISGGVLTDSVNSKQKQGQEQKAVNTFIGEGPVMGAPAATGMAGQNINPALRRRQSEMGGAAGAPMPTSGDPNAVIGGAVPGTPGQQGYPGQQVPVQYPGQQVPVQYPGQQVPVQYPGQQVPVQYPGQQPNYPGQVMRPQPGAQGQYPLPGQTGIPGRVGDAGPARPIGPAGYAGNARPRTAAECRTGALRRRRILCRRADHPTAATVPRTATVAWPATVSRPANSGSAAVPWRAAVASNRLSGQFPDRILAARVPADGRPAAESGRSDDSEPADHAAIDSSSHIAQQHRWHGSHDGTRYRWSGQQCRERQYHGLRRPPEV